MFGVSKYEFSLLASVNLESRKNMAIINPIIMISKIVALFRIITSMVTYLLLYVKINITYW